MSFSYAGPALTTIKYQLDHHELKSLSIWNAACYRDHYFYCFFFLHLLRLGHEKNVIALP